jgi:hypothetical protein
MLATRLLDSEKKFRLRIITALGNLLSTDDISPQASKEVVQSLRNHLSKMRQRNIYGLLEIAEDYPSSISDVVALLKPCSHAGGTLADIFSDRKIPIEIRRQAIKLSGIVGYLDVIPSMERLAGRLETRTSGQRTMPFVPPEDRNEKSLLPTIQTALTILRSP